MLARRALGIEDELTTSGLSDPPHYLPPEPLRSLGGRLARDAVHRAEMAEENGAATGPLDRWLRRLVWYTTPKALEPRLWRRNGAGGRADD